jgi:hypothetical protein
VVHGLLEFTQWRQVLEARTGIPEVLSLRPELLCEFVELLEAGRFFILMLQVEGQSLAAILSG